MTRRLLPPALALFWACTAALATIEVSDSSTATVEKGTILEDLLGDLGFSDWVSMDLTEAEELKNQGVAPGDIKQVYLRELVFDVASPDGGDLSFIDSMEIWVEAPGLESQRVAWQDDFPEGEGTVSFNLDDVDLTDYVVSEAMTLTTDVTAHRPESTTKIVASFSLDVGVTAQGACNQAKQQ